MHLTLKQEATRPPGMNSLQQQAKFDAFLREFNEERPHEALDMKRPAEVYAASPRPYLGLPELSYPLHDRDILVTACGRICMHRKRINVSTVLAGQRLGIKEVDEGVWIVSFMSYDLGFIDLEQKTLQPLERPLHCRLAELEGRATMKVANELISAGFVGEIEAEARPQFGALRWAGLRKRGCDRTRTKPLNACCLGNRLAFESRSGIFTSGPWSRLRPSTSNFSRHSRNRSHSILGCVDEFDQA